MRHSNCFSQQASAKLLKKSFKGLDDVSAIMKADPNLKLSVHGFTDNVGKAAGNLLLSQKRAAVIKTYMVGKGIDGSRIQTSGYGQDQPVADNKTAAGRAKNRRVEFKLNY